jgi:hypothetical protein
VVPVLVPESVAPAVPPELPPVVACVPLPVEDVLPGPDAVPASESVPDPAGPESSEQASNNEIDTTAAILTT